MGLEIISMKTEFSKVTTALRIIFKQDFQVLLPIMICVSIACQNIGFL